MSTHEEIGLIDGKSIGATALPYRILFEQYIIIGILLHSTFPFELSSISVCVVKVCGQLFREREKEKERKKER